MKLKKIYAALLSGVLLLSSCSSGANVPASIKYEDIDFSAVPATTEGNVAEVTLNKGDIYAVVSVKGYGEMKFKLFNDIAPTGVKNFIKLAADGYYTGKNFHRVIADFMIQGGSMTGDGKSGMPSGYSEFGLETNKNMRHFYGALAYGSAKNMNGAQFYIVNNKNYKAVDLTTLQDAIDYYEDYADQLKDSTEYKSYYEYYLAMAENYRGIKEFNESVPEEITNKYKEIGGYPALDGGYTVFGQLLEGGDVLDKISAVEVVDDGTGKGNITKPATEVIIEYVYVAIAE